MMCAQEWRRRWSESGLTVPSRFFAVTIASFASFSMRWERSTSSLSVPP